MLTFDFGIDRDQFWIDNLLLALKMESRKGCLLVTNSHVSIIIRLLITRILVVLNCMSFHNLCLCFNLCTDVIVCIYDARFVGISGSLNSSIFGEGRMVHESKSDCYLLWFSTEFSYVLCIGTSAVYDFGNLTIALKGLKLVLVV